MNVNARNARAAVKDLIVGILDQVSAGETITAHEIHSGVCLAEPEHAARRMQRGIIGDIVNELVVHGNLRRVAPGKYQVPT